jgi:hypothetical protein
MHPVRDNANLETRRYFLQRSGVGLGAAALATLLHEDAAAQPALPVPHFTPRARRVIYLFQSAPFGFSG